MQMNWKKVMAGTLSVCMLATCVPGVSELGSYVQTSEVVQAATAATAISGKCGKKATWKYDKSKKVLTIGGSGAMYNYNYYYDEIDKDVDSSPWAAYKTQIKKVVVGDKVTAIGKYAFSGCSALKEVKLGKSVKKIERAAFNGASKLKKINLNDKLQKIEFLAFDSCQALEQVYIGKSVKEIDEFAFGKCNGLKKIKVSSKNKYFVAEGNNLLNKKKTKWILGCFASDTTCHIGSSITKVNYENLIENTSIESFEVSSDNKKFSSEDGLLYSKDKKTLYMCPKGKKGTATVSSQTTNTMGGEVDFSDYEVFRNCKYLEKIIIGKNMKSLDGNFSGCEKLKNVEISKENEYYASENGAILSKDQKVLCYCAVTDNGTFVVPEGVTEIKANAFDGCAQGVNNLILSDDLVDFYPEIFHEKITLGKNYYNGGNVLWAINGVDYISVHEENPYYSAMDGILYNKEKTKLLACPKGIKICDIPDTVTSVEEDAFGNCDENVELEELYVSDGVTDISEWIIGSKLKVLHLGKSVEKAKQDYTESLETITVSAENENYKAEDSVLYTKDGSKLVWCPQGKKGTISICSGTVVIGERAFYNDKNITEIIIPETVTTIEKNAFSKINSKAVFYVPTGKKSFYKSLLTSETGFGSKMTIKEME